MEVIFAQKPNLARELTLKLFHIDWGWSNVSINGGDSEKEIGVIAIEFKWREI